MIRLLKWLFIGDGHLHKWEIIDTLKVENQDTRIRWTRYVLQCDHCGDLKIIDSNE